MHPVNPINESQSNVTPASSVGSSNSASKSESVPGNSSQEALNQLVSSMDQLTSQSVKAFLNDYEFGFNLHNDALGLNIVLSLSDISLGDIISEVLVSLRSIFNISDAQIDIQLVSLISRVSQMASSDKLTDIQIQDFKLALKELSTHSNQTLRNLANKFLKSGSIGSSQSTQPSDASSNFHAEMLALQSKASEPLSEQVAPTTAAPLSSGQSDMALFDATLQSNGKVITAGKGSIVVDASQSMAGIHATTSGASAHLSAIIDSKQNVHQVGVVDLNGIPIMVMTPFVAALITSYVSKQLQEQRLKVAIVCDSVACLDGMERVDSIYLVDASKDLSSQSFVSIYNDLIDQGYRRILSIHVSPLLDKTYRLAKEASEHIEDIDVKVVNSHANGFD